VGTFPGSAGPMFRGFGAGERGLGGLHRGVMFLSCEIGSLRLGRTDEAKAALRPFADGTFGGYRQREAAQLLEAME